MKFGLGVQKHELEKYNDGSFVFPSLLLNMRFFSSFRALRKSPTLLWSFSGWSSQYFFSADDGSWQRCWFIEQSKQKSHAVSFIQHPLISIRLFRITDLAKQALPFFRRSWKNILHSCNSLPSHFLCIKVGKKVPYWDVYLHRISKPLGNAFCQLGPVGSWVVFL